MSLLLRGQTGALIEQQTSEELVLADRSTLTDIYKGTVALCASSALPRGTFGTGFRLGFVCTSSKSTPLEKGIAQLVINWEAGGVNATLPLRNDEFDLQPAELYPRIERNPLFTGITTATLALAYQAVQGPNPFSRASAESSIAALGDSNQVTLGQALVAKMKNGEETYYLAGQRYVWTNYSYTFPTGGSSLPLSLGGIVQAPLGPLFGLFAANTSLRLADAVQSAGVNGSCYKIMRTWIIAPQGYWDPQLYQGSTYSN